MLLGPGSSLYGADAFGGTINVITRKEGSYRTASLSGGINGYASGSGAFAGSGHGVRESLAFSADRSAGFEVDRDFRTGDISSQTHFDNGVRLWGVLSRQEFRRERLLRAGAIDGTDEPDTRLRRRRAAGLRRLVGPVADRLPHARRYVHVRPPEQEWGSDAGVDMIVPHGLTVGATAFDRHDHDTIDLVRASVTDRWRAENIRTVVADGIELSARAPAGDRGAVSASYTFIDARTDTLSLLSHYALDVARTRSTTSSRRTRRSSCQTVASSRDRPAIEAFYRAALSSGYAGSRVDSKMEYTHRFRQDIAIVDGEWHIGGIRGDSSHADERGVLSAVMIRIGTRWSIAALREQAGATAIRPPGR